MEAGTYAKSSGVSDRETQASTEPWVVMTTCRDRQPASTSRASACVMGTVLTPSDHGVKTGAVLTRQLANSAVLLKGPAPPVWPLRLNVEPAVPTLPSQAYALNVTEPRNPAFGTKRRR